MVTLGESSMGKQQNSSKGTRGGLLVKKHRSSPTGTRRESSRGPCWEFGEAMGTHVRLTMGTHWELPIGTCREVPNGTRGEFGEAMGKLADSGRG